MSSTELNSIIRFISQKKTFTPIEEKGITAIIASLTVNELLDVHKNCSNTNESIKQKLLELIRIKEDSKRINLPVAKLLAYYSEKNGKYNILARNYLLSRFAAQSEEDKMLIVRAFLMSNNGSDSDIISICRLINRFWREEYSDVLIEAWDATRNDTIAKMIIQRGPISYIESHASELSQPSIELYIRLYENTTKDPYELLEGRKVSSFGYLVVCAFSGHFISDERLVKVLADSINDIVQETKQSEISIASKKANVEIPTIMWLPKMNTIMASLGKMKNVQIIEALSKIDNEVSESLNDNFSDDDYLSVIERLFSKERIQYEFQSIVRA